MRKRVFGILLSAVLILSAMGISIPMTAAADTMMVVTVGADLTPEQRNMILNYFNVAGQGYTMITVTNDDEWAHLGGYMSRDIVGYRTISCALIRPMTYGGIQVKTANLTYVTSNMIASNLATAGVTNCEVLAAAPFPVSGTGALTGALMAYENLSGVTLDESKKQAAVQEFATTYELGQTIGQQEAQQIVNDVKMQVINGTLEEDNSITYEEITEIVNDVVNNYTTNNNITNNTTNISNSGLTEADIAALQQLAVSIAQQSYEKGTLDALSQIQKTLEGQTQTTSTAATTQIEQSAAPTTETVTAADTTQSDLSAADQALSQDSLLTNTNESALAGTTDNGSVISSSTAESTIDTSVATNLDTQIEEQQTAQPETSPATTDTGIPEATDVAVIGGDTPAIEGTDNTTDTTIEGTDNTTDTTTDTTTTDTTIEGTDTPGEVTGDETPETPAANVTTITTDDILNGSVTFKTYSTANSGSQPASGAALVELMVPYENLQPVSGALHVTSADGADAALFNIEPEPDATGLVLLTSQDSDDIPEGSTKILMAPKDVYDISLATEFKPVSGTAYTYTLSAAFAMEDGTLDIQINNYSPYNGSPVSESGFQLNGSCLRSSAEGASGAVIFPSNAVFATVEADAQSMANVSINSADGTMLYGATAGANDTVNVMPIQSGAVTLTITYYSEIPEDGMSVNPDAEVGTAEYTIYFK